MTEVLVAVGALLLITGSVVAASLLIESGGRVRVPVEPQPLPSTERLPGAEPHAKPRAEALPSPEPDEAVELVVEGEPARDQLVAAVFAAYAAARLPEANRVAAWVTSAGWPPGRTGSAYRPGVNLRGRPAAVQQLLECDVEGRCWVTVNDAIDVDRGVRTRPPTCELLQGVCALRRTLLGDGPLAGAALGSAHRALSTLAPVWEATTVSGALDELHHAVQDAAAARSRIAVTVAGPVAPVDQLHRRPSQPAEVDEPVGATA